MFEYGANSGKLEVLGKALDITRSHLERSHRVKHLEIS